MKYFLDTEFIEGFYKPFFGRRRHFIDLISIGVVREDGATYYAISTDFNPRDAGQWVKDNVLDKLPPKNPVTDTRINSARTLKESLAWKSNRKIMYELAKFFGCYYDGLFWRTSADVEVYGYYADYDWVLFCSLFGTMISLPKGFPMYCRDLKQMLDARGLTKEWTKKNCPDPEDEHHALADAKWNFQLYQKIVDYSGS